MEAKEYNETFWLNEFCTSNGYEFNKADLKRINELELFLSALPKLPSFEAFSSLCKLRIVGCNVKKIEKLESLPNLLELWICEAKLQKMDGFQYSSNLEELYLYDNEIAKIESLSNLSKLKTLWLNKNKIELIENLENLTNLKILNLSDNKIRRIDPVLNCNNMLEDLNLSGNFISSLEDITSLTKFACLSSLALKDPMSTPNPVALLCNYSTYVLYHIPTLKRLDGFDVSQKNLKDFALSTVLKKKIYYKMKMKSLDRSCTTTKKSLAVEMDNLQEGTLSSLRKLINCMKEIERELSILGSDFKESQNKANQNFIEYQEKPGNNLPSHDQNDDSLTCMRNKESENNSPTGVISKEALINKLNIIKDRIKYREMRYENLHIEHLSVCKQIEKWTNKANRCLQVEFASGGNIKFEEGSNADVWYNSCLDLVQSRFSSNEYKDLKITGIKIHKITRVQNRLLKMKFDQKLEDVTSTSDAATIYKDNQGRRLLDYLFLRFDNKIHPETSHIVNIIEKGFVNNGNQKAVHSVQLTNSVYLSDKYRIKTMMVDSTDEFITCYDKCPYRFGQLLICKVYIGRSCPMNSEKKLVPSSYPNHSSVYQTKKHQASTCPTKSSVRRNHHLASLDNICECNSRRCTWFPFDRELILPEYIVDFEYQTVITPPMVNVFSNIVMTFNEDLVRQKINHMYLKMEAEHDMKDEELLSMQPEISSRPRLTFLTEEVLLQQSGKSNTFKITDLNLHGSGLSKAKLLSTLTNLKTLILSFNDFTNMNDFCGMNSLEYLDVSFNNITGLDGLKALPSLSYLDVSWNKLYYTREDVGLMRKYLPALKVLKTEHNPWMKKDSLRLRCIGRLHSLTSIDGMNITEKETNLALRLAAASRIASITVLANSRTDSAPPFTLQLAKTTELLMLNSSNKPVKLNEEDKHWFNKVTSLHLNGHHLSKISNLEKLGNLKWAAFDDNDITKIEGLEACKQLKELSLSHNCITKLEGLNHLSQLEVLDISNNYISSFDAVNFEKLERLQHLSLDNNYITSLKGLQKSTSLVEIFVGNNKLHQMREIFYLKNIPSLIILDMLGNPFVEDSNTYRLFIIYHLSNLKALDGTLVEYLEGGMAKDAFGGKLTTDFIAEKLGHSNFMELCELDLPNYNIRSVELSCSQMFNNLRSLNLEQNSLSCFGGIINLVNLRVLCLNHNHIESIVPKKYSVNSPLHSTKVTEPNTYPALLECLEVLHLGYNGISNVAQLQLARLPALKALFLQGNDIAKVIGFDGLTCLKELVLDKNKIKNFQENSFHGVCNLTELHVEENRLRDLSHLECLSSLERLYLGLNRIQDSTELEKLENLTNVFEISFIGNPIARKLLHRPMLVFRQRNLLSIDGIPVTNEERTKADMYFLEQESVNATLQAVTTSSFDGTFPGLVNKSNSLKVSSFSNIPPDRYWLPFQHGFNQQMMEHSNEKTSNRQARKQENGISRGNQHWSRGNRNTYDNGKYHHR